MANNDHNEGSVGASSSTDLLAVQSGQLAWIIEHLVEKVDVSNFPGQRKVGVGRAYYSVKSMLKICLYYLAQGITSSRAIERSAYKDKHAIRLTRGRIPNFTTVCQFRRENKDLVIRFLEDFIKLAESSTITIDGQLVTYSVDEELIRARVDEYLDIKCISDYIQDYDKSIKCKT
ncbi:MAG: transposase [Christensenellaceae bacterium]|jgi:transposase|nr:transposase [Christensenellaceae bacterium]